MVDSLYIHIPFCLSRCKYCDFYSNVCKDSVPDNYVEGLIKEIKYRLNANNVTDLNTIYIGGGTPSLLNKQQLNNIFMAIKSVCNISENCETTIEVNPDDVTEDFISLLNELPVNRISCGIQSLNDKALIFCNRRAKVDTAVNALEIFKNNWKGELSLDLICGLPEDNKDTFLSTLSTVISYKPDHISMYSLTIEEESPLGKMVENGSVEYDFDYSDEMWMKGYGILKESGYDQYEVSNFCKNGKQCKHNLRYWNHENYLGCGSGATGTVYNCDGSAKRWTNIKNIEDYCNFWNSESDYSLRPQEDEIIAINDSIFEYFMMGLRKRSGVSSNSFKKCFKTEIPEKYESIFQEWNKKQLMEIEKHSDDTFYFLNEKGILFLNALLSEII